MKVKIIHPVIVGIYMDKVRAGMFGNFIFSLNLTSMKGIVSQCGIFQISQNYIAEYSLMVVQVNLKMEKNV
jgi:hypothetical protein